jgi:hypothetical protein
VPQLSVDQRRRLFMALLDAFGSYAELQLLFGLELDPPLARIAAPGPLDQVVNDVIGYAERHGRVAELVTAARLRNPGNPALRRLVDEGFLDRGHAARKRLDEPENADTRDLLPHGDLFDDWPLRRLERVVNRAAGFQEVVPFATTLLALADRVCRIEVVGPAGTSYGSGFLVGADIVLTNHHVVADVIDGPAVPSAIRFRFDFRIRADKTVDHGTEYGPADRWLLAMSPHSPADLADDPTDDPAPDELDYALIRLDGSPGADPVSGRDIRGWMDLAAEPPRLTERVPLLILQHPSGAPIKLAQDSDGVLSVNSNQTRVTYGVNTLYGSSGSPCFTWDLRLAALHHAGGGPRFGAGRNEGIPIAAVTRHLRAANIMVG